MERWREEGGVCEVVWGGVVEEVEVGCWWLREIWGWEGDGWRLIEEMMWVGGYISFWASRDFRWS